MSKQCHEIITINDKILLASPKKPQSKPDILVEISTCNFEIMELQKRIEANLNKIFTFIEK